MVTLHGILCARKTLTYWKEFMQRKATRMVSGLANLSYEERIEAMDSILSSIRRLRGCNYGV